MTPIRGRKAAKKTGAAPAAASGAARRRRSRGEENRRRRREEGFREEDGGPEGHRRADEDHRDGEKSAGSREHDRRHRPEEDGGQEDGGQEHHQEGPGEEDGPADVRLRTAASRPATGPRPVGRSRAGPAVLESGYGFRRGDHPHRQLDLVRTAHQDPFAGRGGLSRGARTGQRRTGQAGVRRAQRRRGPAAARRPGADRGRLAAGAQAGGRGRRRRVLRRQQPAAPAARETPRRSRIATAAPGAPPSASAARSTSCAVTLTGPDLCPGGSAAEPTRRGAVRPARQVHPAGPSWSASVRLSARRGPCRLGRERRLPR